MNGTCFHGSGVVTPGAFGRPCCRHRAEFTTGRMRRLTRRWPTGVTRPSVSEIVVELTRHRAELDELD
jgi:hypothetical protein